MRTPTEPRVPSRRFQLDISIVDPMLTFEAVFEPLEPGQATLTVLPNGRGEVEINPQANHYNLGQVVHLLAVPATDQQFQALQSSRRRLRK